MKIRGKSYLAASTLGIAGLCFAQNVLAQQVQPQSQPGAAAAQLPPVNVVQDKRKPAKVAQKKAAPAKKRAAPVVTQPVAAPVEQQPQAEASDENLVRLSPVAGSEIDIRKVPGAVSRVSAADVERSASPAVEDALQQQVPGIILSDRQGSSFQTDIEYRGFVASPVNGVHQGLAVYQNGVRINEVFGDTVNWDMIPASAINDITVVSGNPVFGLNALGGAVSVTMKDGFKFHGVESDTRVGSYGRLQEALQGGIQSGNVAAYIALEGINDDGFRDHSPARVRRTYGDFGVKRSDSEFHLNFTGASNYFGVVAPAPTQLLDQDWSKTYTWPQTTKNEMGMLSLNGTVTVTPTLSVSGVAYARSFQQKHVDGNMSDVAACEDNAGLLCLDNNPLFNANGLIANPYGADDIPGSLDRTGVSATSLGGSLQATSKAPVLGHNNQFTAGVSVDHGNVESTANSELGIVDPNTFYTGGFGIFPQGPAGIVPVDLKTTTDYIGLYFTNTFDLTSALSLTAGGRFNYANLKLDDQFGTDLNGEHSFQRFNPMAGLTYKITPRTSFYGSYSEANRAPTPAELSCADPTRPCLLENFLVSDPELKQVVSHTWEAGLRGNLGAVRESGKLEWTFGLFHTLNTDDIINVASPIQGRGYFQNAGETLRQGIEASVNYRTQRMFLYANYAYTDATFQTDMMLSSPNNPQADENGEIAVHKGDTIPAIPAHRLKLGADYNVTDKWKVGADVILASNQVFQGDEGNDNAKLPGYTVVNLHTSYDVTRGVQLYGIVNNVFDEKYATYGTYFETMPELGLTDARTMTPAQPLSVYGGLKMKF